MVHHPTGPVLSLMLIRIYDLLLAVQKGHARRVNTQYRREEEEEEEDIMEAMNESYSHSSLFIATARQNKDFQISHTLKLA